MFAGLFGSVSICIFASLMQGITGDDDIIGATHHNTATEANTAAAIRVGYQVTVADRQESHGNQIQAVQDVRVLGVMVPDTHDTSLTARCHGT